MPLIKALAHACIKTNDLDKTTAFYCETLGMENSFCFMRKGKVVGFYLEASPTTFIKVFDQRGTAPNDAHRALHRFRVVVGS